MGYSVSKAGFVFAFFGLGAFTGAFVGGKLTDKIGFLPGSNNNITGRRSYVFCFSTNAHLLAYLPFHLPPCIYK
jgi:MFS family permease